MRIRGKKKTDGGGSVHKTRSLYVNELDFFTHTYLLYNAYSFRTRVNRKKTVKKYYIHYIIIYAFSIIYGYLKT